MIKVSIPGEFLMPLILHRFAIGGYVDGLWIDGTVTDSSIQASVQPVPPALYRFLPEGDSPLKFRMVYYNGNFLVPSVEQKPDEITHDGIRFQMTSYDNWKHNGYESALFEQVHE